MPAPTPAYIPSAFEQLISDRAKKLIQTLNDFIYDEVMPTEKLFEAQMPADRWSSIPPVVEELKKKARALGLWNIFLHKGYKEGAGLTNLEYAVMAELTGTTRLAPEATNCAAPDTGNMEVFAKYGTPEQKKKWLIPLMNGEIRSAFSMTERFVASSDATNIQTSIKREGNEYVINGRKWWSSGAMDPRCKVLLVMGKNDPNNPNPYKQQSVVIVPLPHPGVNILRHTTVLGYDDAPHGHAEIVFDNVRVPKENMVLGEGRGFEIIQGRLGPGRIHHCMRCIGACERAMNLILARSADPNRKPFGKSLKQHDLFLAQIAELRIEIESARLLVLNAADMIDRVGAKGALRHIAIAKIVVPQVTGRVLDRAMQVYGAEGICQDQLLAEMYAQSRTLRIADGPDEVHLLQLGRYEVRKAEAARQNNEAMKKKQADLLKSKGFKAHL